MKKVILFDFDGTIADSLDFFRKNFNVLAKKHNFLQVPPEKIEMLRGKEPKELMKLLGISLWKIPFIAVDIKQAFKQDLQSIPPIPDINTTLDQLKKEGFSLGILTSNAKDNVEAFLKKHNITAIDFVYGDVGMFGKSRKIQQVLKEKQIAKDAAFYVGDEVRDIEAARKAGIKIISVAWGYNNVDRLKNSKPDLLAVLPKDILTYFKKH